MSRPWLLFFSTPTTSAADDANCNMSCPCCLVMAWISEGSVGDKHIVDANESCQFVAIPVALPYTVRVPIDDFSSASRCSLMRFPSLELKSPYTKNCHLNGM